MELKTRLHEDMKTALKAGQKDRLAVIRMLLSDVQNIDLMIVSGFCRNCLGDWYREAAAEKSIVLEKDEARGLVYGMAPSEWKKRYQKEATPEQIAAFAQSQKTHS